MTRCTWGWIFLQQSVVTFCETITKCAHVGLRVATEFDFTSEFLVWHMWRGVYYCLTSEDYFSHRLLANNITYRFCFLVRIKSKKCHWKLYSCFHAFALWHIYKDGYRYVAVLQECLDLLSWFMNNGEFPFLLYVSRMFPDKKMGPAVKRKLSLGTFLWSYGRTFSHIWTIMCRECDTQCVCQGQLNLIFKNLFGMIKNVVQHFYPNIQTIYVPLANIHQQLAVVFTSLQHFVWR
jgi:hypothetical protein